jgi:FtsH-binding integral membrane protein
MTHLGAMIGLWMVAMVCCFFGSVAMGEGHRRIGMAFFIFAAINALPIFVRLWAVVIVGL